MYVGGVRKAGWAQEYELLELCCVHFKIHLYNFLPQSQTLTLIPTWSYASDIRMVAPAGYKENRLIPTRIKNLKPGGGREEFYNEVISGGHLSFADHLHTTVATASF